MRSVVYVWRVLLLGFVGFSGACLGSEEGDGGGSSGGVFEACAEGTQCESGLICAPGGYLANRCVFQCDSHADCEGLLGPAYACHSGLCTGVCGRSNCIGGGSDRPETGCSSGLTCRPSTGASCLHYCMQ